MENSPALFVCAVGNNRKNLGESPSYTSCFGLPNILSVRSVNSDGGFSYFSSYGNNMIDLTATGRNVSSLFPNNETRIMDGTSMSAGAVTGAAAAVLSFYPEMGTLELRNRLISCSDRLLNLQDKVREGRRMNLSSVLEGTRQDEIIDISPHDDFDPTGHDPTESELLDLYSAGPKVIQIAAWGHHTLALKEDGTVWAWGDNTSGQLGDGSNRSSQTPVETFFDFYGYQYTARIVMIAAGESHSLALDSMGYIWAWGDNTFGQLGIQSYVSKNTPQRVWGVVSVSDISTKSNHNLAKAMTRMDGPIVFEWGLYGYAWDFSDLELLHTAAPHIYNEFYSETGLESVDIDAGYGRSLIVSPYGGVVDAGKAYVVDMRGGFGYIEPTFILVHHQI